MAALRFARSRYLKQLVQIQAELESWRAQYADAAPRVRSDHLRGAYAVRAVQLAAAISSVKQAAIEIAQIPT